MMQVKHCSQKKSHQPSASLIEIYYSQPIVRVVVLQRRFSLSEDERKEVKGPMA